MEKEELRELINGILKHNHENPPAVKRVKCTNCVEWIKGTPKCKKYPNGIPKEKTICRSFRKKV